MSRLRKTVVMWAALIGCGFAAETHSMVRFANGDQLSGSLESLASERLVWRSPALDNPTPFLLSNVLDVSLPTAQPEFPGNHEALVTLTNGDVVRGQLAGVSDEAVLLDTWFGGRLTFNRVMVSEIKINDRPVLAYRGPTGLDGWQQSGGKESWIYRNSSLRSMAAGGIARNVDLPDACSVAFDVAWHGSLSLKVVVFSDSLANDRPSSGYEVMFQQRSVYVRSCHNQKLIGNSQNALALAENEKARIDVRVNRTSGTICVLVNGRQIDQAWVDPEMVRKEPGRGIHFVSGSTPLQISQIEVAGWDGESETLVEPPFQPGMRQGGLAEMDDEESEPSPEPGAKPAGPRMELRNGDSIVGEVTGIQDGKISVKTRFREVKLPIEALRSVALKPAEMERCKRENGDVRAWFPDGSSMVFRLISLEDGFLTGFSQNFGTARLKLAAFSRIEFNIYEPQFDEPRLSAGDW